MGDSTEGSRSKGDLGRWVDGSFRTILIKTDSLALDKDLYHNPSKLILFLSQT